MELKGKLYLITGGGSGIGRACCELAAENGASVLVADLNVDGIKATLESLKGTDHFQVNVDVTSEASVDELGQSIQNRYGRCPDAVINCAGIASNLNGIEHSTLEEWNKVIGVNLTGTFLINRKFSLLMKANNVAGSIVNISSINAKGLWNSVEYSASKGGVESLTKSLAKELAPWGIRVNAVAPGAIDTAMSRYALRNAPTMIPDVPLGRRMGEAKEAAKVCLFLASDKSSYVTASVYEVHGGYEVVPGKLDKN